MPVDNDFVARETFFFKREGELFGNVHKFLKLIPDPTSDLTLDLTHDLTHDPILNFLAKVHD